MASTHTELTSLRYDVDRRRSKSRVSFWHHPLGTNGMLAKESILFVDKTKAATLGTMFYWLMMRKQSKYLLRRLKGSTKAGRASIYWTMVRFLGLDGAENHQKM